MAVTQSSSVLSLCAATHLENWDVDSSYFKPRSGLPNPKGPLSASLRSRANANQEVEKVLREAAKDDKKRGYLPSFLPLQCTGQDLCVVLTRIIILHYPLPPCPSFSILCM